MLVVGGGIVGLAVAREYGLRHPGARIVVVEKESSVGEHQTGHNSGVIHSGVYYRPGTLRARLCVAGARSMVEYCRAHGVPVQLPGKLIVATRAEQVPRLRAIEERAVANGVPVRWLAAQAAREIEPAVACVAALHVPGAGITEYRAVAQSLAGQVRAAGGEVLTGARVRGIAGPGSAPTPESSRSGCWSTARACTATGSPGWRGCGRPRTSCRSGASTSPCAAGWYAASSTRYPTRSCHSSACT